MMKSVDMPVGTALVLKVKEGVNETQLDLKEGEYFIMLRESEEVWRDILPSEQPDFDRPDNVIITRRHRGIIAGI